MVVLARESRGLRQSDLARRLSVSSALLSRIEAGVRAVSDDVLRGLSETLDYPEAFFAQTDPVVGYGTSELFHRRKQNLSNRTLDAIHAQINLRRIHLTRLLKNVDIGEVNIPLLDVDDYHGDVEAIARAVRAWWQVPRGPIADMTKLIEEARALVIPFDFGVTRIDAISQWPPGMPPLIFIDANSTGDRDRLTLAHELGHMVMHTQNPNPEMERQAYRFAAEFLMPEKEVRPYLFSLSLEKLANLKSFWKVSMAALLKRATDLEVITQRHAKTLWARMSRLGYRIKEPVELDIPVETPTLYQEIIDVHRNELGFGIQEFSKLVTLHEHETRHLYFRDTGRLRVVST